MTDPGAGCLFRVLGPVEVRAGGGAERLAARKPRAALVMLLAHAGRTVPLRTLIEELWEDEPPRSAVANLRTYVMRLRRLLPQPGPAGERLSTTRSGYRLDVHPDELDLSCFERLSRQGRAAARRGDLGTADALLSRALRLCRGPVAEDLVPGPRLRSLVAGWAEAQLATVEDHVDVRLALGDHAAVVPRLRRLVDDHPLREGLYGRLVTALYRCGDVPAALAVIERADQRFADELGVGPSAELRRLRQDVLRRAPELDPPVRGGVEIHERAVRPHELPPEPAAFVGREPELARVEAVLHAGPRSSGAPRVAAVHGPPGAGASALALRAAHRLAPRFPDGVLYADLRGTDARWEPAEPVEVLEHFVRALGGPPGAPPTAGLFRSLLCGRRVLVVLDNAIGADQVEPLLPAESRCAVLVTSRVILTTLDAEHVGVGVFDRAESLRLLATAAGATRSVADPAAATDIARRCGDHPLAVRIAAARLAGRPDWSLRCFADRLGRPRRCLDELHTPRLSVRDRFETSYVRLGAGAATLFRLLGRAGRATADPTVRGLVRLDDVEARRALDELVEARLLDAAGDGRFRMHPLVRLYAAELAARPDVRPAVSHPASVLSRDTPTEGRRTS